MLTKTKLKINEISLQNTYKFQVLILNYKPAKNSFAGKILGLKLCDWLKFSCQNIPSKIIDINKQENILDLVKDNLDNNFDYTLVLSSKTPLITNQTINNICEYATMKQINLCKLPSGYIVKNKYLKETLDIQIDSFYSQNIEDFYIVENVAQFKFALQTLADRINTYHMDNGVEIINPSNTYIEPFVDIDSGVQIYPNNSLKGKTTIHSGVILKENNVIENSKIGANSCISGSQISDSLIGENVYISAYSLINNSFVGNNSIIGRGASIYDYDISENSKIAPNSILGEKDDSDSRTGKSR